MDALLRWVGVEKTRVSHSERLVCTAGGMIGIFLVGELIALTGGATGTPLLVASMGASAVLLFAVPHGALSQPWAVVGGHLVSALVGVTCARWLGDTTVAAALAVGIAIGAMHYLRCVHPPGGATALTAVIGGPAVTELGYQYVLAPVGIGAVSLVLAAVLFNLPFSWRRYPAARRASPPRPAPRGAYPDISHADLVYALSEIDSFVDVTEDDLIRIYELATRRPHPQARQARGSGVS